VISKGRLIVLGMNRQGRRLLSECAVRQTDVLWTSKLDYKGRDLEYGNGAYGTPCIDGDTV